MKYIKANTLEIRLVILISISLLTNNVFAATNSDSLCPQIKKVTIYYLSWNYMVENPRGYLNDSDIIYEYKGKNAITTITNKDSIQTLLNSLSIFNLLAANKNKRSDIRMVMDFEMSNGETRRISVEKNRHSIIEDNHRYIDVCFMQWVDRFIPPTNAPLK